MSKPLAQKDLLLGATLLKRFAVERRVAGGSVSDVYLARQVSVGSRNVAVRVLKKLICTSDSPEARVHRQRFSWEAELMSMLRAACFTRILEFGAILDEVQRPFMVLEFVSGTALSDDVSLARRFPLAAAARTVLDVAEGLSELHGYRIVYRDLAPSNILMEEIQGTTRPRLFDFSHATVDGIQDLDATGVAGQLLAGTPPYAAPELASGKGSVESDVFSLSALLYAMLVGEPPMGLRSTNWEEYVAALSAGRKPCEKPLSRPDARVPRKIEALVADALSVKPENRPKSVAEFTSRLCEGILSDSDILRGDSSGSLLSAVTRVLLRR
jgi:serine/threonine-protein kinase